MSELILYTTEDGRDQIHLRAEGGTVWLSQLEMAELFSTTKQNVSPHLKNIFEDGELREDSTVKESLTVRLEGNREVQRSVALYNLDAILAVGFRVRSPRGIHGKPIKTMSKNFEGWNNKFNADLKPYNYL